MSLYWTWGWDEVMPDFVLVSNATHHMLKWFIIVLVPFILTLESRDDWKHKYWCTKRPLLLFINSIGTLVSWLFRYPQNPPINTFDTLLQIRLSIIIIWDCEVLSIANHLNLLKITGNKIYLQHFTGHLFQFFEEMSALAH